LPEILEWPFFVYSSLGANNFQTERMLPIGHEVGSEWMQAPINHRNTGLFMKGRLGLKDGYSFRIQNLGLRRFLKSRRMRIQGSAF
jgi:hypothetical protein